MSADHTSAHMAAAESNREGAVVTNAADQRDDDAFDALIVTIDGPAGTGKSSVGRSLARRLGLEFLDTGAMYRAATALAIDHNLDLADGPAVARLAAEADPHFDWRDDPPTLLAFQEPYTNRLRDADVSRHVSPVSALPELREVLVRKQRIIGAQHPRLVTEGRDQGTVVFPDADVKFFVHASPRVRAQRRLRQTRGADAPIDAEELARVEQELADRDRADMTRTVGPLVRPDDAIDVDTSDLEFDEVVDRLERLTRRAVAASRRAGR
jgi:cytidylate kinase